MSSEIQPVDLDLLERVFNHMALRGTPYLWGAKAPALDCDSSLIQSIDCSGFVRYTLARATGQSIITEGFPDGSVNQHDWCKEQGLQPFNYYTVRWAMDSQLFIAFIPPVSGAHPGHVWLVNDRTTMESHGGRGVSSRAWNYRVLKKEVSACFELPATNKR